MRLWKHRLQRHCVCSGPRPWIEISSLSNSPAHRQKNRSSAVAFARASVRRPTVFAPTFTPDSRLMLFAPHPDDEALVCSIILQHAVRADAPIRVVYATDGDDNPWPQRVLERKWRLNAADRKRWGKLRRAEALGALRILGVSASSVRFLALPDQGLTDLLKCDCRSALERFRTVIRNWSPTHLLVPSIADTHPDHSALAVMLRLVLAEFFSDRPQMSVWSYAVHGRSAAFFDGA